MCKFFCWLCKMDQLFEENFGCVVVIEFLSEVLEDILKVLQCVVYLDIGIEFYFLIGLEMMIGCVDLVIGICLDVDLMDVDVDCLMSCCYVKIVCCGEKFFLVEEIGMINGIFVNGCCVEIGVLSEMQFGDEVQFGFVKMDFCVD